jgi:hypothetical protein
MFADTEAIRALGTAGAAHAADLADVAAALSAMPFAAASSTFGPVGAGFLSALAAAAADGARTLTAVRDRLSAAGATAHTAAAAYDTADDDAGALILGV